MFRGEEEGDGVRSGPGAARTILLFHIISSRPSKQPLMVRTFLKVYMELGSYFLFLQEQIKDIIIIKKDFFFSLATVTLPLRDIQLRLSKGATGVPLFTTWDSVAGPGRTPMPGNNSGRRQPGNSAVPSR